MKYKLIKPINQKYSALEQILFNRGIDEKDMQHYLHTTDKDINSFKLLGEDILKDAATALLTTIKDKKKAIVIVDGDCDGYTSAALLINYLHILFPSWVENYLTWIFHTGKQHGLNDCINYLLKEEVSLILCPDSSSNDYIEHKKLKEMNKTVLVMDHHQAEEISKDAIIINNQLSNYPNKALSGVGVTWQFCNYLDFLIGEEYANNFLDLVALGLVGDMMDIRSFETKHLINKGFEYDNVNNSFIYYMWQKNKFKLGEEITSWGAAFYIVPFVNAIVRSGTQEEKELLFDSMLDFRSNIEILSNKRGHNFGETEPLYEQALRACTNVKNRQTKEEQKGMTYLEEIIKNNNMLDNKVLLFILEQNTLNRNIAGLIANRLMSKYQRPCCILFKAEDGYCRGSARGYEKSGIKSFKDVCNNSSNCEFAVGHSNAFGLSIKNEEEFLTYLNECFKSINSEPIYSVDYIYKGNDVKPQDILDISNMDDLWGQGVEESHIAIEYLKITKDMVTLMSPDKNPTLKITLPNKVCIIKFGSSEEEYFKFISDGYTLINIVGTCNQNEWNGIITPQVFITDYEILEKVKYYF